MSGVGDGDEVGELRAATARLSEQVGRLGDALQTVNTLREKQMQQEARLLRTEGEVHDQHALAEHVVGHLEDIDAKTVTRAEAVRRWRIVVVGVVLGGLLLAALFAADSVTRAHDLRRVCEQRNAGNAKVQQFLDNQVRDNPTGRPLTPEQRKQLALLRQAFPVIHCNQIR